MLKTISSWLVWFVKSNIAFLLGTIFGSVIGTLTTVSITMGMYGGQETLTMYNQILCGG